MLDIAPLAGPGTWASALRPPSFWRGPVWPPPLAEAAAALEGRGTGAQSIGKYPARWLVYGAACAAQGGEEALVEAYEIFRQIVRTCRRGAPEGQTGRNHPTGPGLHAAALHNAALTLGQFHSRPLLRDAARAAARAAEEMAARPTADLVALAERLAAEACGLKEAPVDLAWDGPGALRPHDTAAAAAAPRIAAMPGAGVEGRWDAVRRALRGYGLAVPAEQPVRRRGPSRVTPRDVYLAVG